MEQHYGRAARFALGVEEELLLVDAETHALAPVSAQVIAAMQTSTGTAKHDLYAALVEIATPICRDAGEAERSLAALRAAIRSAGGTPVGVGIHPAARFGEVELVDQDRYRLAAASMRGLMRRTPECALHVHVGMPDAGSAVRAHNALREHMPLLQALAAASPLWYGVDSGLASARMALIREYPRTGIQRPFADHDDWEQTVAAILEAGELADETFLWWDLRLHPRLGTVEVRSLDSQSSLPTSVAIAALVQALARRALEQPPGPPSPREALAESSFRASRDGLAATLHAGGRLRPVPELAREALDAARPYARELGSDDALEGIERLLREGAGADRQRAALRRGGIEALLSLLVAETARP